MFYEQNKCIVWCILWNWQSFFKNCCRWNLSLGVYAAEVTLDTSVQHTDMRIHGQSCTGSLSHTHTHFFHTSVSPQGSTYHTQSQT